MVTTEGTQAGGRLAGEAAARAVRLGTTAETLTALWRWLDAGGYDLDRAMYFQPVREDGGTPGAVEAAMGRTAGFTALRLKEHRRPLDGEYRYEVQLSGDMADALRAMGRAAALDRTDAEEIRTLHIDIETYCEADLAACGVYRYAEDPTFRLLLFAYSVNGGPVEIADIENGEALPARIRAALTDEGVAKYAHNALFEHTCLERWTGEALPWRQWHCTMHMAARCGYPQGLEACGEALGIARKKMKEGKALVRLFCTPNKRKKTAEDWEAFKAYCVRDTEAETDIHRALEGMAHVPAWEREVELDDWAINDRGVAVDTVLAAHAAAMFEREQKRVADEMAAVTGLGNPNSTAQLRGWLSERTGAAVKSVGKKVLGDVVKDADDAARRVAALRAELGKTSCVKYRKALDAVCKDGRVHGLTQYYGAARTGRWAGRLVQTQNLPQNHLADLDYARQLVKGGDAETLAFDFGAVTPVLSELIRTMFVAPEGRVLRVADYSAIEARVIAWLAGETWVLNVFRTTSKIYEATAAKMFRVPAEQITKHDPRRQKGKIAVLSLGYGGGVNALRAMGGERLGLTEGEMEENVRAWRLANPAIVALWSVVENTVRRVVLYGGERQMHRGVTVARRGGAIAVALPSGRELIYPEMGIDGKTARLVYMGQDRLTGRWTQVETYGGKLTENIVQAIARDCLATTLHRLEAAGYPVVFHVHDEAICECDEAHTLDGMLKIFSSPPRWAPDLPLKGEGYSCLYYRKD